MLFSGAGVLNFWRPIIYCNSQWLSKCTLQATKHRHTQANTQKYNIAYLYKFALHLIYFFSYKALDLFLNLQFLQVSDTFILRLWYTLIHYHIFRRLRKEPIATPGLEKIMKKFKAADIHCSWTGNLLHWRLRKHTWQLQKKCCLTSNASTIQHWANSRSWNAALLSIQNLMYSVT